MHIHIHTYTYIHIHTQTYTYIPTPIYTHTYIHTHTRILDKHRQTHIQKSLPNKDKDSETIFKRPFQDETWPYMAPSCSDAGRGQDTICETSDFDGNENTSYRWLVMSGVRC